MQIVKCSCFVILEKYYSWLGEESSGNVNCMSFMDGCSCMQSVKNFSVENPIQYFLPDNVSFQLKCFSYLDENCLSN